MSPPTIGIIGIVVLFILFAARMPVAFVMGLTGLLGFSYLTSIDAGGMKLAQNLFQTFASYDFSVVPLFVWMGFIAFHSGISGRLYLSAYRFLGHLRGGLNIATIAACTAFGAICGSSTATTATMGVVAWPEMKKRNYDASLGSACIAAGGILGVMIPPSITLIVYAYIAAQSISKLFIASILPGVLLAILYSISIYTTTLFKPNLAPAGPRASIREMFSGLAGGTIETLVIFAMVIGGLFAGLFTPTEAGAAGAASVLVVCLARRKLTWQGFVASLADTTKVSAMVMLILAGAFTFGHFIGITGIPFQLSELIGNSGLPPMAIWAWILAFWLIAGCFMDALALTVFTLPILLPMIQSAGFDLVWLGPMLTLIGGMGVLTPPVGMDCYVCSASTGVPLGTVFRGIIPFLIAIAICIAICTIFPQIVLFLPGLL